MTSVRGVKRNRRPTKRMDPGVLRKLMETGRAWCKLALVVDPDENLRHYELVEESGALVDIMVEIETVPDRQQLTCRLSGLGGSMWSIPAVGDEVIVAIPDARNDFMPTIVAVLPTIPNPSGQGPSTGRTIITSGEVFVHDGTGGAQALATKADYDALKAKYDGHKHAALLGGTASVAGLTSSPASDPTGTSDPLPAGTFTTVFKAK